MDLRSVKINLVFDKSSRTYADSYQTVNKLLFTTAWLPLLMLLQESAFTCRGHLGMYQIYRLSSCEQPTVGGSPAWTNNSLQQIAGKESVCDFLYDISIPTEYVNIISIHQKLMSHDVLVP
jgi:hypothetical protein